MSKADGTLPAAKLWCGARRETEKREKEGEINKKKIGKGRKTDEWLFYLFMDP